MDTNNERDTHFQHAAQCLTKALYDTLNEVSIDFTGRVYDYEFDPLVQPIIARFAYDLVYYLLENAPYRSGSFDVGWGSPSEIHEAITGLPDLTEWPTP